MLCKITARLVQTLKPTDKRFEIRDIELKGFLIRVLPSGMMSYECDYRLKNGRRNRITIGRVGVLTPAQARDEAIKILADATKGIDANSAERRGSIPTFLCFLNGRYGDYLNSSLKSGLATLKELRSKNYLEFHSKRLNEVSPFLVETYRMRRKREGVSPATINRGVDRVRALLTKAVDWGLISSHPFKGFVKPYRHKNIKTRFLSKEEEQRLRLAMRSRDQQIRAARRRANEWRKERGYSILPEFNGRFVDYLEPAVLLSMNLGIRQGELLASTWENVRLDGDNPEIFIPGEIAKSGRSRSLPLNHEAVEVLREWKIGKNEGPIFVNRKGNALGELKRSWKTVLQMAGISNFRWHDLRHTFASNLACAGLDINIIRELLGHADMRMTLRYAHLSKSTLKNAVETLSSESWNLSSLLVCDLEGKGAALAPPG